MASGGCDDDGRPTTLQLLQPPDPPSQSSVNPKLPPKPSVPKQPKPMKKYKKTQAKKTETHPNLINLTEEEKMAMAQKAISWFPKPLPCGDYAVLATFVVCNALGVSPTSEDGESSMVVLRCKGEWNAVENEVHSPLLSAAG